MSSVIHALGLKDSAQLKFPVGLYTTKAMLRGDHPFAVIYEEKGKTKLRVGGVTDMGLTSSKVVVD